ncbi:MAG: class I SAM-dependent methyltransferase [Pseudomonadota bacterium]
MSGSATANFEKIRCPVCDGDDFADLFEKQGEPFVRCQSCTLVLINPRPRFDAVSETYDAAYSDTYLAKAEKKLKRAHGRVARIKSRYERTGRWLDVGCSAGFIVKAATEAGFEAWGVDLEAAAINYGKHSLGLANLSHGQLLSCDFPDQHFDVISMYDVIEHVPELPAFVEELKRILKPDGIIDIGTPDVGHWRVPRDLGEWSEIKPSEHLYYFSYLTLARLLNRHGLRIVKKRFNLKPGIKCVAAHLR